MFFSDKGREIFYCIAIKTDAVWSKCVRLHHEIVSRFFGRQIRADTMFPVGLQIPKSNLRYDEPIFTDHATESGSW